MKLKLKACLILLITLGMASTIYASVIESLADVKNNNIVKWHLSPQGNAVPELDGVKEDFTSALKNNPALLLPLLEEKDRFVAAHVLLSISCWGRLMHQNEKSPNFFMLSAHNFGPLEVYLRKNGPSIDLNQKDKISKFWHEIIKS